MEGVSSVTQSTDKEVPQVCIVYPTIFHLHMIYLPSLTSYLIYSFMFDLNSSFSKLSSVAKAPSSRVYLANSFSKKMSYIFKWGEDNKSLKKVI